MVESYNTVSGLGTCEYIEKHSRFIATVVPVTTQEEAVKTIDAVRSKYWDAKHNVYAYTLLDGNIKRYSDDNEPQGTAGMPVLNVLEKLNLQNVLIVVTRYFGGILLGAGGLVRAYSHTAKLGVEDAGIVKRCLADIISLDLSYPMWGKIQNYIEQQNIKVKELNYTDMVNVLVCLECDKTEGFKAHITEISDGQIECILKGQGYEDFANN